LFIDATRRSTKRDQGVGIKGSEFLIMALVRTCIEIFVPLLCRRSTKEVF